MKLLFLALIYTVLLSACKKDKSEPEEELPELGTCRAVKSNGKLAYSAADKSYTYRTAGGGEIFIHPDFIRISHEAYAGFTIEFWGETDNSNAGTHENLNGKHIKDRLGNVRSLIFPDGTKLTMNSTGVYNKLVSISIYEGSSLHHINLTCHVVEFASASSETLIRALDRREPDGETGSFEFTADGLTFFNMYTESEDGTREEKRIDLGTLVRDNPNQVNDLYDDKRLSHT